MDASSLVAPLMSHLHRLAQIERCLLAILRELGSLEELTAFRETLVQHVHKLTEHAERIQLALERLPEGTALEHRFACLRRAGAAAFAALEEFSAGSLRLPADLRENHDWADRLNLPEQPRD